jgi:hypothetical protein
MRFQSLAAVKIIILSVMPCSSLLSYPDDRVWFHFIISNSLFHDGNESLYLKKQGDVPLMTGPSVDRKFLDNWMQQFKLMDILRYPC